MTVSAASSSSSGPGSPLSPSSSEDTYEQALEHARLENYHVARQSFRQLLSGSPYMCKAWVSWAQMEKRCGSGEQRFEQCRRVLQEGLARNPSSSCLIQAWGLMELQRGNLWAALMLLERGVKLDPERCAPVMRWHQVDTARKTVGSRRQRHLVGGSNAASASGSS